MRISLFLNSTMSKSCVRPEAKNWHQHEKESSTYSLDNRRPFSYEASGSMQPGCLHLRSARVKQLPDFMNACYELQWLISSRSVFSQALDAAVKQIHSLSAMLLLYLTLLLLSAQVVGLVLLLSCAVSLPIGFQFMMAAVVLISATAFKIMY